MDNHRTDSKYDTSGSEIVFVSNDRVLTLDLNIALWAVGLRCAAFVPCLSAQPIWDTLCRALILDADALDDDGLVAAVKSITYDVVVVVISDSEATVRTLGLDKKSWFMKPVFADAIAWRVSDLLLDAKL